MKITKHQNTSVLQILQPSQGFTWTPEGLKAEELATREDLSPKMQDLIDRTNKNISEREKQEYYKRTGRDEIGRLVGEQPLESEDWKFATALAGGVGTVQAASTMGWVPAITTDVASGIGGTTVGYGSNWVGQKIDNKFGTNVTPWLTVAGSLLGGMGGYRAGYKGAIKGAKYAVDNGIRGYSDFKPELQKQILPTPQTTQEPLLNIGWAPKQTIDVHRAGNLTEMYYPKRWDVIEEGANPFGVWLQGKFGIHRTDITNPGKGVKAKRARELFAERPQYNGQVTLDKPIQTVGEVPNRSALSYDAERMGADGIIYNGVYDNGYNNNQVIFSFKRPKLDKSGTLPKFQPGGSIPNWNAILKANSSGAPFMMRVWNLNKKSIPDWESNKQATHKLAYHLEDDGFATVYPEVQEINGELIDFTDPKNKDMISAYWTAVNNNNIVKMSPEEAEWFTKNYKKHYPGFKQGGTLPTYLKMFSGNK